MQILCVNISPLQAQNSHNGSLGPALDAADYASIPLSLAERDYLTNFGPIRLAVDPDWEPYEWIDENGNYRGIAADLLGLLATRLGIEFQLVRTKDWDESLALSKSGQVHALAFLNQTPARDEWLVFTEPYFTDPNVFITREEHDYIFDPLRLSNERIVFPSGTSLEERIRQQYPNLKVLISQSEREALNMVVQRQADMTLRSLTMAAYVIRNEGYFSLKIAGQIPDLANNFRIGIYNPETQLRDILDLGIKSITPQDVQRVINRFISIEARTAVDYSLIIRLLLFFGAVALLGLFFYLRLQTLNRRLRQREAELLRVGQKLSRYSDHLRLIIDTVPAYIYAKNPQGQFILANRLFAKLFNTDPAAVVGKTNQDYGATAEETARFNHEDKKVLETGEELFIPAEAAPRPDGSPGWFQTTKIRYQDPEGEQAAILGVSIDITEQRRQEELIRHMAQHDSLTGLANRRLFSEVLQQKLAHARRTKSQLAIFFIDLDGFKPVNDEHGHEAGDAVLKAVADRITSTLRETDLAGRIGGDEFVACAGGLADTADSMAIAEKLIQKLQQPIAFSSGSLQISASIGIALYPEHGQAEPELMQAADQAMYRSKRGGRGQICLAE